MKGATRKAVESLVQCYKSRFPESPDSLFITEEASSVYWGHMSVLDADLVCLNELRKRNKNWKHAATLAGTGLTTLAAKNLDQK